MMSMKETAVNKSSVTVSELAITGACIALTFVATGFINIRLPLPGNGGLDRSGSLHPGQSAADRRGGSSGASCRRGSQKSDCTAGRIKCVSCKSYSAFRAGVQKMTEEAEQHVQDHDARTYAGSGKCPDGQKPGVHKSGSGSGIF